MAIVYVGPSETYTTVAAAAAAMPADLIATGEDYIIELKAFATTGGWLDENRIVLPNPTNADANHRPILRSFAGGEVDGSGAGNGLKSNRGFREIIRLGNWWQVEGLHIENDAASGYGIDFTNATNTIVKDCWLSGGEGAFYLPNSGTPTSTVENCILSGEGNTRRTLNLNGIDGTVTMDRITAVDSDTDGIEGSNFAAGTVDFTNCFSIGSTGSDYDNRVGASSASDYLASGDTSATAEVDTTAFTGRTTTNDLADYAGGDYNLKSDSTLKGAGSGGSDVGATLPATAATGYSITLDTGSYAYTGQSVDVLAARKLDIASGGYSYTGQSASLLFNRKLDITSGNYSYTGQSVDLLANRKLDIATGAYTYTGQAVTLTYNAGGATYTITLDTGNFALTGQQVNLLANRKLDVSTGAYAYTGQSVDTIATRKLDVSAGAYIYTGQPISLLTSRLMPISAGGYSYGGQAVTLSYSGEVIALISEYTIQYEQDYLSMSFNDDFSVSFDGDYVTAEFEQ